MLPYFLAMMIPMALPTLYLLLVLARWALYKWAGGKKSFKQYSKNF